MRITCHIYSFLRIIVFKLTIRIFTRICNPEIGATAFGLIRDSDKTAPFALTTGNHALNVFGCGLEIHDVALGGREADINLNITEILFPVLKTRGTRVV